MPVTAGPPTPGATLTSQPHPVQRRSCPATCPPAREWGMHLQLKGGIVWSEWGSAPHSLQKAPLTRHSTAAESDSVLGGQGLQILRTELEFL